jgi:hypothetical protein
LAVDAEMVGASAVGVVDDGGPGGVEALVELAPPHAHNRVPSKKTTDSILILSLTP